MLKNLDSSEIPQANAEEKPVEEAEENVAGHPLRPATDRRLGRPLPCQLAMFWNRNIERKTKEQRREWT